jgi:hypothetical protein
VAVADRAQGIEHPSVPPETGRRTQGIAAERGARLGPVAAGALAATRSILRIFRRAYDAPSMIAFALFFSWFAAVRQRRFTMREAGLSIVLWIMEWLDADVEVSAAELRRMKGWLSWAEWCARRADPAAARQHLRPDLRRDPSAEALVLRLAGAARVLMGAPATAPRLKRKGGMTRRVRHATTVVRSLVAASAPPIPAPP